VYVRSAAKQVCSICDDPSMYFSLKVLASDEVRHALLLECPSCGALWEVFPEVKEMPTRLTVNEARSRFPGAL
jgi:uncharacterized Zn finger protein